MLDISGCIKVNECQNLLLLIILVLNLVFLLLSSKDKGPDVASKT